MPLSKISIFACASFALLSFSSSAMDLLSIIENNTQASSSHNLENTESVSSFFCEVAAGNAIGCCFLLEARVSVHVRDAEGRTPLMIAALNGHIALCKLLIQNGALIDTKDPKGQSALSLTTNPEIKELLSRLAPFEPKRKLSSPETEPE